MWVQLLPAKLRRRLFGQHGKALPIQHQCIGQQGDLFLQVGNLICSLQAEVSAFYRCLRQMGR